MIELEFRKYFTGNFFKLITLRIDKDNIFSKEIFEIMKERIQELKQKNDNEIINYIIIDRGFIIYYNEFYSKNKRYKSITNSLNKIELFIIDILMDKELKKYDAENKLLNIVHSIADNTYRISSSFKDTKFN